MAYLLTKEASMMRDGCRSGLPTVLVVVGIGTSVVVSGFVVVVSSGSGRSVARRCVHECV